MKIRNICLAIFVLGLNSPLISAEDSPKDDPLALTEDEKEMSHGQRILKHNSEIKEKQKALEAAAEKHGRDSEEFQKAKEEYEVSWGKRKNALGGLKQGQGLRYKMRRDIGASRIWKRRFFEDEKKE